MEKRYRVNELSRLGNRNDCPLHVIELWKIKMLNLAITFDEKHRPQVIEKGCTGCGICTNTCPTEIPAITININKK